MDRTGKYSNHGHSTNYCLKDAKKAEMKVRIESIGQDKKNGRLTITLIPNVVRYPSNIDSTENASKLDSVENATVT